MVDFCRVNSLPYTLWVPPSKANKRASKKGGRDVNVKFLKFSLTKFLILLFTRPLLPIQVRIFSGYKCDDWPFSDNDVVYVHTLRMDAVINKLPPKCFLGAQIDFSAEFLERANGATWPFSLIYSLEARLLSIMSANVFTRYKKIFRVTADEFVGWDIPNIVTNPHGFDANRIGAKPCKKSSKKRIGFFGNMSFLPNKLAAIDFIEWCKISALDCEFVIFGKQSKDLKRHGTVICLGEVQNIDSTVASLDLLVNLVSVGAGFQNKTIEAWAQNVPVVGYEQAFRGLADCSHLKIVVSDISQLDARIKKHLKKNVNPAFSEWVEQNWDQEKNIEKRFEIMGLLK